MSSTVSTLLSDPSQPFARTNATLFPLEDFRQTAIGTCAEEWTRLRQAVEEHKSASNQLSFTLKCLTDFCLKTRVLWSYLCEGYLLYDTKSTSPILDLVKQFETQTGTAIEKVKSAVEHFSGDDKERALNYLNSIGRRREYAIILRKEGIGAVYARMLRTALDDEKTTSENRVKSLFHEEVSGGLAPDAIGFIRTSYFWFLFRLANLASELRLEHGPYPAAVGGHYDIAQRTIQSSKGIKDCMTETCGQLEEDSAVGKFARRFDEHVDWFCRDVLGDLKTLRDPISEMGIPADCEDVEEEFGKPAESLLCRLLGEVVGGLQEIECFWRQLESFCGRQLSILVDVERGANDVEVHVAHALELGVVGQGVDARNAIKSVLVLAELRRKDIESGEYDLPLPAFLHDFAAFDSLESQVVEVETRIFSPVVVTYRRG